MASNKTEENITKDEAVVLYYIWRHKQRSVTDAEMSEWIRDNEIYEMNIKNGFDLLVASKNGRMINDSTFEFEIKEFRLLTSKKKNEVSYLTKLIMPYYRPSKRTFIEMWNTTMPEPGKLFVAYIRDNRQEVFGCRWMGEIEIENIKQWENKNSLDCLLSLNYDNCLEFFKDYNFIFPCDYTSHGNPRQYRLHKTLKEFLFSEDFPYGEDLDKVKEKHNNGLPF